MLHSRTVLGVEVPWIVLSSVKTDLAGTLATGDQPTCRTLPDDGAEVFELLD